MPDLPDKDTLARLHEAHAADEHAYARHLCEQILVEHPTHCPTLLRLASNLISLGQFEQAEAALNLAEKFISENRRYSVLAQRGHLLLHKGHFADAKAKYLDAYDLEPDEATWLIFAASAAFHLGDIEGAEQLARRATECSEGCIDEAWFNLGGYLLSQKRYEEARDCYRRALAIDPDYEIAKKRLSDVDKIMLQPQSDSHSLVLDASIVVLHRMSELSPEGAKKLAGGGARNERNHRYRRRHALRPGRGARTASGLRCFGQVLPPLPGRSFSGRYPVVPLRSTTG